MSYRTAQGKTLDMAALVSKNETARAVGNMKVNARGDTIDSEGNIIVPVTEKVADNYAKTVGHRSAQPSTRLQPNKPAESTKMELNEEEKGLLSVDDESDIEVENIKAKESKK